MDYQSVSMRAIARTAGVDTSLVGYYFGTKQELYLQTISLPSGPHRIIAEACASSSIDELGETLVRSFLTAWPGQGTADQDDRTAGNSMQGMTQALLQEPDAFHNLHDFYQHMIVEPVAHLLGTRFDEQEAEVRAALAVTQLLGIFITRTIVGLDALRHLPDDELIAREAPTLQTILTGSLPSSAPIDDVWKDNPGPANTVPVAAPHESGLGWDAKDRQDAPLHT